MAARDYELLLKVTADMRQALDSLRKLEDRYKKNASAGERAAQKLRAAFERLNGTIGGLRNLIIGTFAVREVVHFTRTLVDANVQMQKIHYGLQQAFGSSKAADEQFKFIAETAKRLGLNLVDAAEGYKDLAASAQGTSVGAKELQRFFVGLSEAASVLHISAADLNGIMVQLSQGLSLGKLQMQDLRAVAQHLPGTFSLLSGAFKDAGLNLGDLLKKGGLPAAQTLDLLGKALHDRFSVQAKEASHSLQAEINRMQTSIFELETTASKGGFLDGITNAIRNFTKTLNDPGVARGFSAFISGLGTIASKATTALAGVANLTRFIGEQIARDQGNFAVGDRTGIDQALSRVNKEIALRSGKGGSRFLAGLLRGAGIFGPLTGDQRLANLSDPQLEAEKGRLQELLKLTDQYGHAKAGAISGNGYGVQTLSPLYVTANVLDPKKAAAQAKRLEEAQRQLGDVLTQLRERSLSPAAQAWADYAKAVEKAAQAGGKAIAAGANVGHVQAQVLQAVQLAKSARETALGDLNAQLRVSVLKATGQQAQAASIELHQRYDQLFKDLLGEGDKAGAELVRKLINVGTARAELQQLEAEVQRAFEAQAQTENSVNAQVNAGLLSQYEAQQKIVEAHQQTIDKVDQLLPKMRELAAATGDPAVVAHVKDIGAQVDNLKVTANQAAQAIKNGISSAASSAVDSLVSGTATLGQAVRSFVRDIVRALAQLATNKYLDQLLNGSKGGKGGGFLSTAISAAASYFGGGKASGGLISGPGTGTSDSILTPTSDGEFVTRSAVTSQVGALPFLHDFNARGMAALRDWGSRFRGYAGGGLIGGVAAPRGPAPRLTDGGLSVMGAGRDLHQRIVVGMDSAVLDDWAKGSAFERAVKVTISRNPSHLRQTLRNV